MSDEPRDPALDEDEPTPGERAWMSDIPERVAPPPALRERVVERLAAAGEIASGSALRAPAYRTVSAAAALVLAFLAGGLAGRLTAPSPGALGGAEGTAGGGDAAGGAMATEAGSASENTADASPRFVLLLYEDERFQPGATVDELVEEYGGWARDLAEDGALVLAEKLSEDARVVPSPVGGDATPDAPFPAMDLAAPEGLGALTGFFIVRAVDYEEAARMARASPHAGYGGRVVVRRIDPT